MNDNKDSNYNLNIAHSYKEWDTHAVSFINKHIQMENNPNENFWNITLYIYKSSLLYIWNFFKVKKLLFDAHNEIIMYAILYLCLTPGI